MLTDTQRLRRAAAAPRLVALHRALGRLRSCVTVMNTGAHPDDEHSEMLALLRHQMGMRIVVACSTRGEGGQNSLGPERGAALGVLRSRELEEAARVLDADIAWLGHGPSDPVHDFGFSKSGSDTLARWGETRILDRLARAYRQFRPDIVIPTFLDVPGQHGHHRAMTEAAERALALAADPAYPSEGLAPWDVAKFYLPAWSGGGDTYDDESPPPPATIVLEAQGTDSATGLSYDRLGEVSRTYHASQNMGAWRHPAQTQWALHRVGNVAESGILDGLPTRLADLGPSPHLAAADTAIAEALANFADDTRLLAALAEARRAVRAARDDLDAPTMAAHGHRLARKMEEIDAAMALAACIDIQAALSAPGLAPGGSVEIAVEIERGRAERVRLTPLAAQAFKPVVGAPVADAPTLIALSARDDAPIVNPFHPNWLSLGGNGAVSLRIEAVIGPETIGFTRDLDEDVQVNPDYSLAIDPQALILPLPASGTHDIALTTDIDVERIAIDPVPGLALERQRSGFRLAPAAHLRAGRHTLPLRVDGAKAHSLTPIAYPHIGNTRLTRPLALEVLALDLAVPSTRIGYVGGGADRVALWLKRMGADVTELGARELAGDLSGFDTIVVGIFAFGTRPDLAGARQKLHRWIAAGGHLLTLYHRPSDGWEPETTPPLPLRIGSPSLRWRVTDPAAPVTLLAPEHELLAGPNRIGAEDFAGWDKERGLYFASRWDKAYVPLLSLQDAGEAPLTGALLSAPVGQGRHSHTSLVLHHQMDRLVPGAFRLMANLLQARM